MTTESSMLHVRMDTEMKQKATAALAAMGLTASEAVRLLFRRIAVDQAFPARTQGAERPDPPRHGRGGRDGEAAQRAVRQRGRGVFRA